MEPDDTSLYVQLQRSVRYSRSGLVQHDRISIVVLVSLSAIKVLSKHKVVTQSCKFGGVPRFASYVVETTSFA